MVHQAFEAHLDVHILGKDEVVSSRLTDGSMLRFDLIRWAGQQRSLAKWLRQGFHKPPRDGSTPSGTTNGSLARRLCNCLLSRRVGVQVSGDSPMGQLDNR